MSQTVEEQPFQDSDAEPTGRPLVAESIRYRKRAQGAERKVQELTEQLHEAHQRIARLSEDVDGMELDRKLTGQLAAAGATDLEAAVLIAKARMAGEVDGDIDACIRQLRSEKGYLFAGPGHVATPRRTAGVKERPDPGRGALEHAATRAARTGSRTDLQAYLKLRRHLV